MALGSKHKDPKTLLGYIEPSSMSLMAGKLGRLADLLDKLILEDDDDDDEPDRCSS